MSPSLSPYITALIATCIGIFCGYYLKSIIEKKLETKAERLFLYIGIIFISLGVGGIVNEIVGSYLGVFPINKNNIYKYTIFNIILFPISLTVISIVWKLIFGQRKKSNTDFTTEFNQDFYKTAYQELYSDERDTSLWIESLSISKGERAEAEAHYLKHRASQLNEKQKIVGSHKEKNSSRSLLEVIDDNFIPFIFWIVVVGGAFILLTALIGLNTRQQVNVNDSKPQSPIPKNIDSSNQNLEGTYKFAECEKLSDGENIKFNTDGKVEMSVVRKIANYDFIDPTTLDKVTDSFQECGVLDANTIYCNKDDASEANIKHEISVDVLQKIMTVKKLKMKDYGFDVASLTKCSLN